MVLFIGVCYKTPQQALDFARQVLTTARDRPVRVLIQDNSDDGFTDSELALPNDRRATWLRSPSNLGYFGGAAYALQYFLLTSELPDWVIVSNVDLSVDADNLIRVLDGYAGRTEVGVVAPAIVSRSTSRQLNPFMINRPSAIRMHFYKWTFAWAWALKAYVSASEWWSGIVSPAALTMRQQLRQEVYAVHGCFMAFSSAFFRTGGTLTHGTFLYGEEITVAEFCRRNSLQVVLDRGAVVEHLDSMSTSRRIDTKVAKWIAEGARYCADKYFPLMNCARRGGNPTS